MPPTGADFESRRSIPAALDLVDSIYVDCYSRPATEERIDDDRSE